MVPNPSSANKEFDYYAVLNVARDATIEEIALGYRKIALRCHPNRDTTYDKAFNPPEGLDEECHLSVLTPCAQWAYVNRAYDILSHPLRREVYDTYGECGLYKGVPLLTGYFQPYTYHGDCLRTYQEVFGTHSPYANVIDAVTNPPPLFSNEFGVGVKLRDKPIEKIVPMDLKEVFHGSVKRMKILRHEFVEGDQSRTQIKQRVLVVPIAPGTVCGTTITFKEEGDQYPSKIPADIIFLTTDKPHLVYKRDGADMHMDYNIDLKQALCGFKLMIKTIDDRKIVMAISDVITPGYVKEIVGEGLPRFENKKEKGNLFVHFIIKFPTELDREFRAKFMNIFNELRAKESMKSRSNIRLTEYGCNNTAT